ncbi:hypothetical protein CHS0354_006441, partial [Potamilus streckersoni]
MDPISIIIDGLRMRHEYKYDKNPTNKQDIADINPQTGDVRREEGLELQNNEDDKEDEYEIQENDSRER